MMEGVTLSQSPGGSCPPSIPFLSLSFLLAGGEAGQNAAALRDRGVVAHGLALLWTPDFLHLPLLRLVLFHLTRDCK